jgi:amidase
MASEALRPADDELAFAGLRAQARLLAEGGASSRELVELTLARIAAARELGAFRCVLEDAALEAADAADRRLATGERAPLLGVPVAIKDDMDLATQETRFGCAGSFEPKGEDGAVAAQLKRAGAVIVGKTNTPELGQWPFTSGPAFGVTRNPWSLQHTPGGSSGGSAAAVAAGLVAAAVGSDGAGSVRIPAAWTGLVGVKPQRGRVSTAPEPEAFNGLTCIGPLARTVGDAALLLDVLAGPQPSDLHRPPPPADPFEVAAAREPGRLRVALSLRIPFSGAPTRLAPEVRVLVERMAGVLAGLGHDLEAADPSYGPIGLTFLPRCLTGVHEWSERVPQRELLDPRTHHNATLGRRYARHFLGVARAAERPLQRLVGRIFRRFDVVLAPTTAKPPPPVDAIDGLGSWATDRAMVGACPYAWAWNVLGWPGVSVPAGHTDDGLPVGVQLLGPANSEGLLLSLAAQLEASERWHDRRPSYLPEPLLG